MIDLDDFREYLASLGMRPKTVGLYAGAVRTVVKRAGGEDGGEAFARAVDGILRSRLTGARKATYRKAALHWAAFCGDRGLEADLRARQIKGEKKRKAHSYALDRDDYLCFLSVLAEEVGEPAEWAAILLIATTGARIGDVLGVTRDQLAEAVDAAGARPTWIEQKGGKERELLLATDDQIEAGDVLLRAMRPGWRVWQVPALRGRATQVESVANRLRCRILEVGQAAGIPERVTPQILRKSLADEIWDREGRDARLVAQALGDTIGTVQKHYIDHPRPRRLADAMRGIGRDGEEGSR